MREIAVTRDIVLRACGRATRSASRRAPVLLDGHGHTLRQGCFEKRLLRQDGTGYVELQQRHAHPRRQRRARAAR